MIAGSCAVVYCSPFHAAAHIRPMASVISSLENAPSDSRLHKVKRAVNTLDKFRSVDQLCTVTIFCSWEFYSFIYMQPHTISCACTCESYPHITVPFQHSSWSLSTKIPPGQTFRSSVYSEFLAGVLCRFFTSVSMTLLFRECPDTSKCYSMCVIQCLQSAIHCV